jgi:hypothetical protein
MPNDNTFVAKSDNSVAQCGKRNDAIWNRTILLGFATKVIAHNAKGQYF